MTCPVPGLFVAGGFARTEAITTRMTDTTLSIVAHPDPSQHTRQRKPSRRFRVDPVESPWQNVFGRLCFDIAIVEEVQIDTFPYRALSESRHNVWLLPGTSVLICTLTHQVITSRTEFIPQTPCRSCPNELACMLG